MLRIPTVGRTGIEPPGRVRSKRVRSNCAGKCEVLMNCPVLEDPSIHAVREIVGDGLREGIIDGICGSATDFNGITTLPASTFENAPFALEVGFPCKRWHVVRPTPTLGYAGVLAWADRFLSAPRLWDDGR